MIPSLIELEDTMKKIERNRAINSHPFAPDPVAPIRNQDPAGLTNRERVSVPVTRPANDESDGDTAA